MDLKELEKEYEKKLEKIENLRRKLLKDLVKLFCSNSNLQNIATIMAIIYVVERQINANNRLKTYLRSKISLEIENLYLFIN